MGDATIAILGFLWDFRVPLGALFDPCGSFLRASWAAPWGFLRASRGLKMAAKIPKKSQTLQLQVWDSFGIFGALLKHSLTHVGAFFGLLGPLLGAF